MLVKLSISHVNVCSQCPSQNMKFPEWSVRPSEFKKKLDEKVAYLAEIEKDVGTRNLKVTCYVFSQSKCSSFSF